MGGQLRVDLDQFRSFVHRFAELSGETGAARSTLVHGLDGEGECWGADQPGAAFASKYASAADDTLEAILDLGRLFDWIGDRVGETAQTFEQTDTGTGVMLGSIDPGGEG